MTVNTAIFALTYLKASSYLMDVISLTGAERTQRWFQAADQANQAIVAAHTPEEEQVAKQLLATIYITESS